MTDDLTAHLRAAVPDGSPPDLADLWSTARHRDRRQRGTWIAAAVVVAVALIGAAAVVAGRSDSPGVDAAGSPGGCAPRSVGWTPPAPTTAAAFVTGEGEGLVPATFVGRVKVVRTWTVDRPHVDDHLVARVPPLPTVERRAEVEVVEVVEGRPGVGRRLKIADTAVRPFVEESRRLMARIDALQDAADARPGDEAAQRSVLEAQRDLEALQLSDRLWGPAGRVRPMPCYRFREGDELLVALAWSPDRYELTGPNSFFLVDGDRLSAQLDADRQTLPEWKDSPLQRLARTSTVDELLAALRAAR